MVRVLINKFIHLFEVRRIKTNGRTVYLTFDDGPEPDIIEFVLEELSKYGFKATFFCFCVNAEKYPELLSLIKKEEHAIGNHTYSHLNGLNTPSSSYVKDVIKANSFLSTNLFRPPRGCLRISSFLKISLGLKMKVIHWSLSSGDYDLDAFDLQKSINILIKNTTPGDVVLFHSCKRHEKETKLLLPQYLRWLKEQKYNSIQIKV